MKLPDPKLRLPIALLITSLLIGAGIFHFSLLKRLAAEARLISTNLLAAEAARGVREAPARLLQDQADAELHAHIRARGFIGQENRAGWITALAQTQALLQLNSLSWHLSPQTASPLAPDLKFSKMAFSATPINPLSLDKLFTHLRETAPGRFTVEHCTLTLDTHGTNGQANCHLNWWTLTEVEH